MHGIGPFLSKFILI